MEKEQLVKIQTEIMKAIRIYVGIIESFPETFARDQCLARFHESLGWCDKCINAPEPKSEIMKP